MARTHCARRALLAAFAAAGLGILGTCAASHGKFVGRVMVKFKPDITEPEEPALVADLNHTARASVRYLRPVGAGAHLYSVSGLTDEAALYVAARAIAARPDVEFAEPDRLMQPAKQ